MTLLLGIAIVLVIAAVIFSLLNEAKDNPSIQQYRVRASVMNKSEQAFFYELQRQLPSGYHIFPNMRIADIINAVDGKGFYNRRNKILPKHIDFLVCDRHFKPIVAIEVNGSSHRRPDRVERDGLVKEVFADAKLPLEFVDVGTSFAESIGRIRASFTP